MRCTNKTKKQRVAGITNKTGITLKKAPLSLLICAALPLSTVWAQGEGVLNLEFLQGGGNAQAAEFLSENTRYFPGRYFVDVQVNGVAMGKQLLTITPEEHNQLCFSPAWLANVDVYLRPEFFASAYRTTDGCFALGTQPDTRVEFDVTTQSLLLTIPQAGLTKADESLDWEFGNNALRLNYNINANKYRNDVSYFGSTSLLANIGEWVANGSASVTKNNASLSFFTVSKALLSLQADIILGKTSVSAGELGGLSTYGATLSSNNSMRRQMQGYTPVFSGVATGSARVTLQQGNTVLYSELVPPGPFVIDNVTVLTGGDVVMTVTENDGYVTQQVFPITLINGQISPGEHEYSVSLGVIDNNNPEGTPTGALGAFSYGYGLEKLSLRAGALLGSKFIGITGNVTTQLGMFGSMSAGVSATQSRYSEGDRQGQKSTLTYAKTFDFGTSIQMSYNRLSDQYDTLGEYNSLQYSDFARRQRMKEDLSIGFSQPLWKGTSVSVNGWERRYWYQTDKQQGVTGNLSTRIGQVNLSVAGSYYKTGQDNQYSISTSVSIPFSIFDRNINSFASMSTGKLGGTSYSAGTSTMLTDKWAISASESWGGESTIGSQTNLWTSYDANLAQLSGQINHSSSGTTGSGSMMGSIMYLPANNSVILSKNVSDTVAVVNVHDAPGVSLMNGLSKTDRNGNVIVPLSRYQLNTVTIDASTLPSNTELSITSKKVKPTGNSVTYLPFQSVQVKRYLLQVKGPTGEFMSPGVWATSESGTPLGFVANKGVLLINTVDALGTLKFPDCQVPASALTESNVLQEVKCERN